MDTVLTTVEEEYVAIGAAIAANCEPCLSHHVQKAREAGIGDEQLQAAVALAQKVKDTPARSMAAHARRLVAGAAAVPAESAGGCCR